MNGLRTAHVMVVAVGVCALGAGMVEAGVECEPHWDLTMGQPGVVGDVVSLYVYDGSLLAGGHFGYEPFESLGGIARWGGAENGWVPYAGGVGSWGGVMSMTTHLGNLVVAGQFHIIGGENLDQGAVLANSIAQWNGTGWAALGNGLSGNGVRDLIVYDGSLIAGGPVHAVGGGIDDQHLLRWNSTLQIWETIGGATFVGGINAIARMVIYNDDLVVGGDFFFIKQGGLYAPRLARWDGDEWHAMGEFENGAIEDMVVYNGDLIVVGGFDTIDGASIKRIARWDGNTWHPMGQPDGNVIGIAVYGGELVVRGSFYEIGGVPAAGIARGDGTTWHAMGSGIEGDFRRAMTIWNGQLIVGGSFTEANGSPAGGFAAWDGCVEEPGGPLGDLDGNGIVNVFDLLLLLGAWGTCPAQGECPADLNGDGVVNVFDLLMLLGGWG